MAIIKEMTFKIESTIEELDEAGLPTGEPERTSVAESGFFRLGAGELRMDYTERGEGGTRVHCEIAAAGERVTVARRGDVECDMVFEKGVRHASLYRVPPYSFDMEIVTLRLENELTADGGRLTILYRMKLGGAERRTRMVLVAAPRRAEGL